jgi:hypothetical protein
MARSVILYPISCKLLLISVEDMRAFLPRLKRTILSISSSNNSNKDKDGNFCFSVSETVWMLFISLALEIQIIGL